MSEAMRILDEKWASTCRVIFGEEVGPLADYREWLVELTDPLFHAASSISGKDVVYGIPWYKKGCRWADFGEIDFTKKEKPLSINEIKDIDSIISAFQERFAYAGNAVIGNSKFVEQSSNIYDSFYILQSDRIFDSKYVAYFTYAKLTESSFGGNGCGESAFCIKCCETFRLYRCFEAWQSRECSGCYYSHNLDNSQDAMFCFNAQNLRHAIGNLPLPRGKYSDIKKKLQSEMAQKLRKDKRLPTLVDIAGKCKFKKPAIRMASAPALQKQDKGVIEEAFAKTCSIVLGKRLSGSVDDYAGWLKENIYPSEKLVSCASGKPLLRWDHCCYFDLPRDRILTIEEAHALGESAKLSEKEALGITLSNAHGLIAPIAFFTPEFHVGSNLNIIEGTVYQDSMHCYRSSPVIFSKYAAYSFWPRNSEYSFGISVLPHSNFCINCYNSVKLSRCLEVDFGRDCSDCYFCHNVENCTDCMFSFNAKNLKHAIGNVEVGKEEYARVKKLVLSEICAKLERDRSIPWSIYSIGAKG